eukprot:jgi/Psemu1/59158/gm1.59158_g
MRFRVLKPCKIASNCNPSSSSSSSNNDNDNNNNKNPIGTIAIGTSTFRIINSVQIQ